MMRELPVFEDLLARVVSRVAPVPTVTPDEYRAITCNRCGLCCEDIRTPNDPATVAAAATDPATDDDRRRFLTGLVPVGQVSGGWRFCCRHFSRDAEGLGVCAIRETRPNICRGFPYGMTVRSWVECAWYVQIRADDGTLLTALPEGGENRPAAGDRAVPTD